MTLLLGPILRLLAIVAVFAAVWGAWDHYVKTPYVNIGKAEIQPQLDKCAAANKKFDDDLAALQQKVAEQNSAIMVLQDDQAQAEKAKVAALAALKASEAQLDKEVADFTALAEAPKSPTEEAACAKATSVLNELATERLRN